VLLICFIASFYLAISYSSAMDAITAGPEAVAKYRAIVLQSNLATGIIPVAAGLAGASPSYFNVRFAIITAVILTIIAFNYVAILKEHFL